ncbi:M43 family zinc metalloprotease [Hymenobacter rubidus]|uniref:M43 family zinc metalloprotease n=1 Tax=Hymenobacter rubidus TaxID=1441626 RepID=UPI00191D0F23|nr:M43 family zinc metalloprotease [Hymenobacter rubidus]
MLKKLLPLAFAALSLVSGSAWAQAPVPEPGPDWCGTTAAQERYFAQHPGAREAQRAYYQQLEVLAQAQQRGPAYVTDITIPVVVHIIHAGGTDNISDAQVATAIDQLNLDYQKLNPDTAEIIPLFRPIAASIGFRFRLAKKDPNGNCTTGITRHYLPSLVNDDQSGAVQGVGVWDQAKYLNIWVVNTIGTPTSGGTTVGYVTPPNSPNNPYDGFVVRQDYFGNIGTSSISRGLFRGATHEIGHYFGLSHTWGNTNSPGSGNCNGTDYVADTPVTDGTFSCNLGYSTCGPVANVQNYMDYSSCKRMFTQGQRALMRTVLTSARSVLTSQANLIATGTNDGYVSGTCAPIVAFQPSATVVCEGSAVTFNDFSYNADLTAPGTAYAWQFPGGVPSTSSQRTPTVTYPTGGLYNVTLTITTAGGVGTATRTALMQVVGGNAGLAAPVAESFENAGFPNNYPAPDLRNWSQSSTSSSGAARWMRVTSAAGGLQASDGSACLVVRSSFLPAGTQTNLISPNINLSAYTAANPPALVFDRAYAQRPVAVNEYLSIQYSNDCGLTWTNQRNIFSSVLNTRDTLRVYGYTPTSAADWQPLQVDIPASYISSHFQVRFRMVSAVGNNIYLDKVRIVAATTLATQSTQTGSAPLHVFPNPLTAETVVQFALDTAGPVEVRLTDLVGRLVGPATRAMGRQGEQTLPLLAGNGPRPAAGIYLVELRTAKARWTSKVVIP